MMHRHPANSVVWYYNIVANSGTDKWRKSFSGRGVTAKNCLAGVIRAKSGFVNQLLDS